MRDKNKWYSEIEQISKKMIEYAKNYKCKVYKKQPEDNWCEQFLGDR